MKQGERREIAKSFRIVVGPHIVRVWDAIVFIKSLVTGQEFLLIPQVPFSETSGGISGFFQYLGNGGFFGIQTMPACGKQDPKYVSDSKSTVTWRDFDLSDASIRRHVVEGMKLTHLGLDFDGVMNCVISDQATFSKIKFIRGEAVEDPAGEDPLARLDADFVLLTGTLRRLLQDLKRLLGGYAQA